jgi:DNA-binding transcriptional ArsR family regulator
MSTSSSSNRKSKGLPPKPLLTAMLSQTRWKILAEMATGDLFMVKDLAALVDDTEASVSKHLEALRHAGITKFAYRRLHQIADAYRLAPDSPREIDFGFLIVRLPDRAK